MFVEDLMNSEIIPALDSKLSAEYKFTFTGYTDETAASEAALMQAEMSVFKSMNDLLTQSQKSKINEPIGDLPLNSTFWALVEKNYTRGEIREKFLGDKGASKRKELQYILGDNAFLAWQNVILAVENSKDQKQQAAEAAKGQQAQAQQAQAQQAQQSKHEDAKHSREEEKHQMEMEQAKADAAGNAARQTFQESAKQFGATAPSNVNGHVLANPINVLGDKE
jgi:hypothetical protein